MQATRTLALGLLLATALVPVALAQDNPARNVILMITDGAGIETFRAASYFRHGALGHEAYDTFDVKLFSSTHPLNTSNKPTKSNENAVTFDPNRLWTANEVDTVFKGRLGSYKGLFDGYDYSRADHTDSAAAGTALASGRKTYNNAINWSNDNEAMKHIGQYAVESGRALGVVSSVQWTHATPAAFLAHNASRNQYAALGREIVDSGLATVVMGAGHPSFDDNGIARPTEGQDGYYDFVGGRETWQKLTTGTSDYRLVESLEDFKALSTGTLDLGEKAKVLGTAQVAATLQFNREGIVAGDTIKNVPDLATMSLGALEVLDRDEDGFFLMVEGGAVDWAAHANNLPRLVEEQVDFNVAVEAVVEWIEKNSSFDETLLIVTTDHGNGLLQGPNSNRVAYEPILNQGAGALPLVRWNSDTHTRELVPVYAKGAGADFLAGVARPDAGLAAYDVPEAERVYVDNTDLFRASAAAMGIKVETERQALN